MEVYLSSQLRMLIVSIAVGALLGAFYDLVRVGRMCVGIDVGVKIPFSWQLPRPWKQKEKHLRLRRVFENVYVAVGDIFFFYRVRLRHRRVRIHHEQRGNALLCNGGNGHRLCALQIYCWQDSDLTFENDRGAFGIFAVLRSVWHLHTRRICALQNYSYSFCTF